MDCPSLPCSRKCRFGRVSQRWTGSADGFPIRRRTEAKGALDSNAQGCEPAREPSRWERLLHAPRAEWSLRQNALEQREAMRAAAARARWTVELAFKGLPTLAQLDELPLFFFRLGSFACR
jgi:hypothetical protein